MAVFNATVEGVWLYAYISTTLQTTRSVYIAADASPFSRPRSSSVFDPDSRDRKIVQFAAPKGLEGTVTGSLNDAHSITAAAWRERLDYLIAHQEDYRVEFVSPHLLIASVAIMEAPLDPWNSSTENYDVSVSFIEVD